MLPGSSCGWEFDLACGGGLKRRVEREWLDELPAGDFEALRSRRDLLLLDFLIGASVFVVREMEFRLWVPRSVLELGAGDGRLCRRLAGILGVESVVGCDFLGRPEGLGRGVGWVQGDLREVCRGLQVEAIVGTLILHHLSDEDLREAGVWMSRARLLIFVEPLRDAATVLMSRLVFPFVGRVTRHDMVVSLRAGFREGELKGLLGLDEGWVVREVRAWPGILRWSAWRR